MNIIYHQNEKIEYLCLYLLKLSAVGSSSEPSWSKYTLLFSESCSSNSFQRLFLHSTNSCIVSSLTSSTSGSSSSSWFVSSPQTCRSDVSTSRPILYPLQVSIWWQYHYTVVLHIPDCSKYCPAPLIKLIDVILVELNERLQLRLLQSQLLSIQADFGW